MDPETLAAAHAAIGRWAGYLSLMMIGGAAGFRIAVRREWGTGVSAQAATGDRAIHLWSLVAAAVLSITALWRLYAQVYSVFGIDEPVAWRSLRIVVFDTAWGSGWRWQMAAAILAAMLHLSAIRVHRARTLLAVAAAVAVVATAPLTGHAVSKGSIPWVSVALQMTHVAAASVWLGTLFVVLAFTRARGDRSLAAAVRAFSPLALVAVAALAISGAATTFVYLDSIADLWRGVYGRTLILKLLLFGIVAGLGAYNWRKLGPLLDKPEPARQLTRSAKAELLIASALLAVTAVLVALPMPHE